MVKAIAKGRGQDIREFQEQSRIATGNSVPLLRMDFINTELKKALSSPTVSVEIFKRRNWQGILVVDRRNKWTFTISSQARLREIIKKSTGKGIHYLVALLSCENMKEKAPNQQITMEEFGIQVPVDEVQKVMMRDVISNTYAQITKDIQDDLQEYTHFVITYVGDGDIITKCKLLYFDEDCVLIDTIPLDKYLEPDYMSLTDSSLTLPKEVEVMSEKHVEEIDKLVQPKVGLSMKRNQNNENVIDKTSNIVVSKK